jgi:hypothetical protein
MVDALLKLATRWSPKSKVPLKEILLEWVSCVLGVRLLELSGLAQDPLDRRRLLVAAVEIQSAFCIRPLMHTRTPLLTH